MGGLVEDLATFKDNLNNILTKQDVAAHWEKVSERSGMPVNSKIWTEDPPQSTYPANIAVKSGRAYLRLPKSSRFFCEDCAKKGSVTAVIYPEKRYCSIWPETRGSIRNDSKKPLKARRRWIFSKKTWRPSARRG